MSDNQHPGAREEQYRRAAQENHNYSPIIPIAVANPRNNRKIGLIRVSIVLTTIAILAIAILAIAILTTSSSKTDSGAIQSVVQPDTSSQVAQKLGCTNFTVEDPGTSGMVIDAGSCIKDGRLYAINTFPSTSVRDKWLDAAEPLGVDPKWETTTSVTYPSVS